MAAGCDRGTGDGQRCCESKWKNLVPREPRRTGCCIFSWRGNAKGLVLICLHYPFHSSFKSTKYTFPLHCPPCCSRQKKSNFPQFAPNSYPLPSAPLSPSPISEPFEPQPVAPAGGWESPGSRGQTGAETPKKPPLNQIPAAFRGDPLLPTSLVQEEHPTDCLQQESPNTPLCRQPPSFS